MRIVDDRCAVNKRILLPTVTASMDTSTCSAQSLPTDYRENERPGSRRGNHSFQRGRESPGQHRRLALRLALQDAGGVARINSMLPSSYTVKADYACRKFWNSFSRVQERESAVCRCTSVIAQRRRYYVIGTVM